MCVLLFRKKTPRSLNGLSNKSFHARRSRDLHAKDHPFSKFDSGPPYGSRDMRNEGPVHVTAAVDLLWRQAVPSLPPLILWMLRFGGGQGLYNPFRVFGRMF